MRTLAVAAVLLMMIVSGAWAAVWLSNGGHKESPIGDIGLPSDPAPRRAGADSLPPAGYFLRGAGRSAASTPTVELGSEQELIIAGSASPAGFDTPSLRRDATGPVWRDDFRRSGDRRTGGSSSGVGFSAPGIGAPGGGGSPGARASTPGVSATRNASAMTPIRQQTTRERPAGTPRQTTARSSSNRSSGGGSSAGGSAETTGAATTSVGAATTPAAFAPAAGLLPAAGGGVGTGGLVVGGGGLVPAGFDGAPSPSPTPEPATMLLLGTGLAGLYRLRRYIE